MNMCIASSEKAANEERKRWDGKACGSGKWGRRRVISGVIWVDMKRKTDMMQKKKIKLVEHSRKERGRTIRARNVVSGRGGGPAIMTHGQGTYRAGRKKNMAKQK